MRAPLKKFISSNCHLAKGILVDVGCGAMPYKEYFSKWVDTYVGLDHPVARAMVEGLGDQHPDLYGEANSIGLKSGSVHTVLMTEVLEHTGDPQLVVEEISRILAADGIFFLTVPFLYHVHGVPYDFFRFTKWGLLKMLGENDFEILTMIEQGNYWTTSAIMANNYLFSVLLDNTPARKAARIALIPLVLPLMFAVNAAGHLLGMLSGPDCFMSGIFVIAKKKANCALSQEIRPRR
jgi:SAM-dependent methyltransferase